MKLRLGLLLLTFVVAIALGIVVGSEPLPLPEIVAALTGSEEATRTATIIVWTVRLPRTLTAVLAGSALALAGAQLQTLFRNPLADPYILGVSSGASLGVACVVLTAGTATGAAFTAGLGVGGDLMITLASSLGAAAVTLIVLVVGRFVASSATLLLLGVMVGYLVSAGVSLLLARAAPELIASFTRWRFGSYRGVTWEHLAILAPVVLVALAAVFAQAKLLNALLLGQRYAATMGLHIARARTLIVITSSVLAGAVTAFCGPIQFLGIAVAHLTRSALGTSDHRVVLPACALLGASLALLADIIAELPGEAVLPLNAVNALFGAPVVIWILIRHHRELLK